LSSLETIILEPENGRQYLCCHMSSPGYTGAVTSDM
jgi:hypothetical protein